VRRAAPVAAALFAALAAVVPARALEHTLFRSLTVATAAPDAPDGVPALLNLPPGWQPGGVAAVLLFDPPGAHALRDTLLVALLESGAAVLELDSSTARGFSMESGRAPPPPTVAALVADLAGALASARQEAGAGRVIAFGHGLGAEAVLRAGEAPGHDGPHYAAVAALGPEATVFRNARAERAGDGWAQRLPWLCTVIAYAQGLMPTPLPAAEVLAARAEATALACRTALLPGADLAADSR
jgi:hypothetical protein